MMSSDEDLTTIPVSERISPPLGARSQHNGSNFVTGNSNSSSRHHRKHPHSRVVLLEDDWSVSEVPSPYFISRKKRQNGDKIGPSNSQSKRSCPGDRSLQLGVPSFNYRNCLIDQVSHSDGSLRNQSPFQEDSSSTVIAGTASSNSDDTELIQRVMEPSKAQYRKNSDESHLEANGTASSGNASNSSENLGMNLQQSNYPLSIPSTSKHGQNCIEIVDDNPLDVKVIESGSEGDLPQSVKTVPLKGGRQFPECFNKVKKVIGKKMQKILYSDDTSDDSVCHKYRRPIRCLSSESDDSDDDVPALPRKKLYPKHTFNPLSSSDSNDDCVPMPGTRHHHHHHTKSGHSHAMANTFVKSNVGPKSAIGRPTVIVPPASIIPSSNGGSSPFLALRNRFSRNKGSARQPISPRPRSMVNTQRHSGVTRSARQLNNRENPRHLLAAKFPDLFEADDSSEVEFFTAPSYSDTETSTESVGGAVNISNPVAGPSLVLPNTNVVTAISSDDDEISIIFAGERRAGASTSKPTEKVNNRRGRSRRACVRLRHPQGSGRSSHSSQEVTTISPDPVAQVRQVEEDEQYARTLQAEFDAEINEGGTFVTMTDSDESAIIDPVGLDPPTVPPIIRPSFAFHNPPFILDAGPRISHHNPIQIPSGRRRRGRRTVRVPDQWMWQFSRVLGLGPAHSLHRAVHNEIDNSYEALLQLTESVEGVPRGLLKSEINRLPTRKFFLPGHPSTSQGNDEVVHKRTELNKECQVCLCDYENGDILRILPCFHEFHTPCIDPWLKINHTCPVCRVEVNFDS